MTVAVNDLLVDEESADVDLGGMAGGHVPPVCSGHRNGNQYGLSSATFTAGDGPSITLGQFAGDCE